MLSALCQLDPTNAMPRPFYSLPPAGNKIPFSLIFRAMIGGYRSGGLEKSESLKKVIGDAHALYLSSGRAALWLILKALSELSPKKNKVIIPAYTCPAVASAVLRAGLQPVLCDINLDDFGYPIQDLEHLIDENVLAVVVVHLFGFPANINEVMPICRKSGVFVAEDAAQAFGNELPSTGTKLGTIGDAGFFSFGRGKPLGAFHGGIAVFQSEALYENAFKIYSRLAPSAFFDDLFYRLVVWCYYVFSNPSLYWIPQKIPFLHLGETVFEREFDPKVGHDSAAKLIAKMLKLFDEEKATRVANSEWYCANLPNIGFAQKSYNSGWPYIRYPFIVGNRESRNKLSAALISEGTGASLSYPVALNKLPGLAPILKDNRTYSNAESLSETLITLPVHSGINESHLKRIKEIIEQVIQI